MEKVLRSFIHEKFDLDTRYEIELLTKRRDLINSERQEELIKLLQSKNVGEIVKLGPGTNRYAFKLDGFVVKVATDHDGKIDNLKEFKMAKRLYPYVAKTYEVSENGTLLVAEYIQPFGDFSEMCKYSEKIKDILQKLSAVYLIGDVGLIPKNFANWGLRVGTQDPVCLDFAYVYDVSSKLFICRECGVGAMLHPSPDFSELVCSNPACLKRYTFESIRAKIGNDIHRHEIGDLSEEGYRLTESHVLTQLDEDRSNYLAKKKAKDKGKEKSPEPDKPTDQSQNKEEPDMSTSIDRYMSPTAADAETIAPYRIRCTATVTKKPPVQPEQKKLELSSMYGHMGPLPQATILNDGEGAAEEVEEREAPMPITPTKVAFSGKINPTEIDADNPIAQPITPSDVPMPTNYDAGGTVVTGTAVKQRGEKPKVVVATVRIPGQDNAPPAPVPVHEDPKPEVKPVPVEATASATEMDIAQRKAQAAAQYAYGAEGVDPEQAEPVAPKKEYKFSQSFMNRAKDAVSRIGNRIGDHMHVMLVHDDVKAYIRDKKMYPETFYRNVQNAAFNSLAAYLGFTKTEKPRDNGKGVEKIYTPPADFHGDYEPTMIFIERIWNLRELNTMTDSAAMLEKYRTIFSDYHGIQPEWADFFERRLIEKMPIDKTGAAIIAKAAKDIWCVPESDEGYDHKSVVLGEVPDVPDVPQGEPTPEPEPEKVIDKQEIIKAACAGTMDPDIINNLDPDTAMAIAIDVVRASKEIYPSYRPAPGAPVEQLVFLQLAVGDDTYPVAEVVNFDELKTNILINGNEVASTIYHTLGDLVNFLGTLEPDKRVDMYSELLTALIGMNNDSSDGDEEATEVVGFGAGDAAAKILGDAFGGEDGDGEDPHGDEEESVEVELLSVYIYNDGDFDIVKLSSGEVFGSVEIPFYCNLDKIDITNMAPSVVDNRNGKYDWLIHMVPDIVFTTSNPERYLEVNDQNVGETQTVKFAILDVDKGVCTMGMYFLESIAIVDDDMVPHVVTDDETLWKINRLIVEDIGYSRISHLRRTLSTPNQIKDEDYVLNDVLPAYQTIMKIYQEAEAACDGENPMNDAERIALNVIMNGGEVITGDGDPQDVPPIAPPPPGSSSGIFRMEAESGINPPPAAPADDGEEAETVGFGPGNGVPEVEVPEKTKKVFHPIRRPGRDRDDDLDRDRGFTMDR